MINLDILEEFGISPKGLKGVFKSGEGISPLEDTKRGKVNRLQKRISSRIKNGQETNIPKNRIYQALDTAWSSPFRQITPTLLQCLIDKDPGSDECQSILKSWEIDLDSVITEVPDPKTGKTRKVINAENFNKITVPLVRAYLFIAWSSMMNERNRHPFLSYEPVISDVMSRMQCDVITNRIEVMNQQYDYFSVVKQAAFQMLHYGHAIMFPEREWDFEEQWVKDGEAPASSDVNAGKESDSEENDETVKTPKGTRIKKVVVKEGIPYHVPHPSRTFWDEKCRPSTFNTDSGCEYAGYWRMLRYRDIINNPGYYNTDKINIGTQEWWTSMVPLFNMLYGQCTIKMPVPSSPAAGDRETKLGDQYYNEDMEDASVMVTEYFEKLNPKENGLGDYDGMVWFRFVIAGTDTIIYAAPLPYTGPIWFGYPGDENKTANPSLSLDVLPFQDQFTMLLTQHLLSVRQNLSNATFVDTDVVGQDWIDKIKNLGEKMWRVMNFIPFSGKKAMKSQSGVPMAFHSHRFQPLDTNGTLASMKVILDVMERVLGISSQEAGQAASHEQTQDEIQMIEKKGSERKAFTGIGLDQGIDAMELQVYRGLMAYGEAEFYAQVPMDRAVKDDDLAKMGFTFDDRHKPLAGDKRRTVKVKKSAIELHSFARSLGGNERTNTVEMAVALANALTGWLAGPLAAAIGPEQGIKMVNIIGRMAGFPRDFKLENATPQQSPEEQAMAIKQQLQGFIDEIKGEILGEVKHGLEPIIQADNQQDAELVRILQTLNLPPLPPHQEITNAPQPAPMPPGILEQGPGGPTPGMAPALVG